VAAQSKAYVYGHSPAEIVGSNSNGSMGVSLLCVSCVMSGRGLCDEMVTRPEEFYRLWPVIVRDQETSLYEETIACAGLQSQLLLLLLLLLLLIIIIIIITIIRVYIAVG
jgi:hypothetical protein